MAYPDLQFPINVNTANFRPYEGAGSGWCSRRKNAKGKVRAYELMKEWGFGKNGSKKEFSAKCSFFNRNRKYTTYVDIINPEEARNLAENYGDGCEIIENMYKEAADQYRLAGIRYSEASGSAKDNAEIDKAQWGYVSGWLLSFKDFQGGYYDSGEQMDTCREEGLGDIYQFEADRYQQQIDAEGSPIPNSLLIGLIGIGALGAGFLLYKTLK